MQLLHHITDQAAPPQQMSTKLFNELLKASFALGAGRILMRFWHWCAHRQEVAHEQRQGLYLNVLIALQLFELA